MKKFGGERNTVDSYRVIDSCRICGNNELLPVVDLGLQRLSGVFPKDSLHQPQEVPLELIKCNNEHNREWCGLVQLKHSTDLNSMYGESYGYRSSLSSSMCSHLSGIAEFLVSYVEPKHGEIVLDIGCNDGTLLQYFRWEGARKVGIDPSSGKFADSLDSSIELIDDYFSEEKVRSAIGNRNCVLITAIAMFYDLEDPIQFLREGCSLLSDDGVLALEFAYMPLMLKNLTYDQVCHEHLTYFSLSQIEWMVNKVGLKIIHASTNMVNGGSIFIGLARSDSTRQVESNRIQSILHEEKKFSGISVFKQFQRRITAHREDLLSLLDILKESGKKIYGYGASTKGNVVLNYCNIDSSYLCGIFDSNQEKHYRITPGSSISILPKETLPEIKPDFLLIMIWHLRTEVLRDELHYFSCGGRGIVTLPRTHLVNWKNYNRLLESSIEDLGFSI